MRSRRWMAGLVAVAATVSLVIGVAADDGLPRRPAIHFGSDVPDDLHRLAASTWERFLDAFPAWWECVPDVTLRGAWQFGTRAAYDPDLRVVTLRIPGTAPNLRATMVHEFAHHLEFGCPAQRALRSRFLAAQRLPPGTPWRRAGTWAGIPSEQFAQATIQVVLGRQPNPLMVIRPEALRAIRVWGRGE